MWRQAGSDLKALAEQFAHSRERELVRRRAEQVDVASLDMQQFMELLKELFQVRRNTMLDLELLDFYFEILFPFHYVLSRSQSNFVHIWTRSESNCCLASQGGQITRERILVLFFFCSDLAIYSVRCRLNGMLAQLTRWSLMFIRGQACACLSKHSFELHFLYSLKSYYIVVHVVHTTYTRHILVLIIFSRTRIGSFRCATGCSAVGAGRPSSTRE